ncbi:unnamed protein product [Ectocarpus sp. 13 AM-2016]
MSEAMRARDGSVQPQGVDISGPEGNIPTALAATPEGRPRPAGTTTPTPPPATAPGPPHPAVDAASTSEGGPQLPAAGDATPRLRESSGHESGASDGDGDGGGTSGKSAIPSSFDVVGDDIEDASLQAAVTEAAGGGLGGGGGGGGAPPKNGRSVAKAMAEAILDEGYIKKTGAAARSHHHLRPATNNGEPAGEGAPRRGDGTPASTAAAAPPPAYESFRNNAAVAANVASGAGDSGGVDAPFGHAIIIEEHVQAGVVPSSPSSTTAAAVPDAVTVAEGAPPPPPPPPAPLPGGGGLPTSSGRPPGTEGRAAHAANGGTDARSTFVATAARGGGGICVRDNGGGGGLWPTTTGRGEGIPEAEGGWGHVDTNGLLQEDEEEFEKKRRGAPEGGISTPSGGGGGGSEGIVDGDLGPDMTPLSVSPPEGGGRHRDAGDADGFPVLMDLEEEGAEEVSGGDDELPGARKLYLAGGRGDHYAAAAATAGGKGVVDETAATATGGGGDDDDGEDGDSFGDQDDATFGQSWDDLVEGVADEGVLHGHGRAGLPDPLETDALLEEGRSDPAAPPADGSGGVGGADVMASDGRFERAGEEQEGDYSPQEQEQPVPGAPSSGLGQTLVGAMAEAIGARRGASLELLGHFLRAGGGDVEKAASLYATMADEFVELREMARRRRHISAPPPSPPRGAPAAAAAHGLAAPPAEAGSAAVAGGGSHPAAEAPIEEGAPEAALADAPRPSGSEEEEDGGENSETATAGGGKDVRDRLDNGAAAAAVTPADENTAAAATATATPAASTLAGGASSNIVGEIGSVSSPAAGGGSTDDAGDSGAVPPPAEEVEGQQDDQLLPQELDVDFPSFEADPTDLATGRDEYSVTISSQKLGMTVENVLERTVVRAAAPGGGAEAAGVETGSLLVALDGQSTKNSSHFEVIELLRVANRPLTLRLRRQGSIVRLLLEFSGLLERDWCRARRDDPQGQNAADGSGKPGGGGAGAGAGTAGRRIENMGVLLEQLAPLLDWESEAVAAVEPELRELLCVLLDADLRFDLSSTKYPHFVGGAVAAILQEVRTFCLDGH